MLLHYFPFLNKMACPHSPSQCPFRGASKIQRSSDFFSPVIPLLRAKVPLLGVYKMTHFSHLLATLGSRIPDLWFPGLMFSFFLHLILTAWRDSDPSLSQALLNANGKRKEPHGGLPLDKGHLYILRHLALPSMTSAGNNLEAGRFTELYSAVYMCEHQLSPQRLIQT